VSPFLDYSTPLPSIFFFSFFASLSVLGDVIKSLGENSRQRSSNSSTGQHIPYRNSILTMVLKNSLGGNSRTVMVANVSPSSADYEETISTLKYADNTKKIRLRVEANVVSGLSASDGGGAMQLVPVLQAEVKKLRELLHQQQLQQHRLTSNSTSSTSSISTSSATAAVEVSHETLELVDQMRARVMELEEQLLEREELILNLMENNSTSNLEDEDTMSVITTHTTATGGVSHSSSSLYYPSSSSAVSLRSQPYVVLADDAIDTTLPRLINLNQDPLFSECLVYYIPPGQAHAGSCEAEVDILLSGPDILSQHCSLENDHDEVFITPLHSSAKIYVNGLLLQTPTPSVPSHNGRTSNINERYYLRHYDRVSMGRYHLFRYEACGRKRAMSPGKGMKSGSAGAGGAEQQQLLNMDAPGWDFAHDELVLFKDSNKLAPRCRSPRRGETSSGQYPPGYFNSIMNVVDHPSRDSHSDRDRDRDQTASSTSRGGRHGEGRVKSSQASQDRPQALSSQSMKRTPSDDWWDQVHEVVDNPKKVNTPAELRAMLRTVMESAEKQFENKFSSMQPTQQQRPSVGKAIEKSEDHREVATGDILSVRGGKEKSPTKELVIPQHQRGGGIAVPAKYPPPNVSSDKPEETTPTLPPPPPPLLLSTKINTEPVPSTTTISMTPTTSNLSSKHQLTSNDYLFLPPQEALNCEQKISSNPKLSQQQLTKTRLPSNDTKTVDILYAERRSITSLLSSASSSSSTSVAGRSDEMMKIRGSASATQNGESASQGSGIGIGGGGGSRHRYSSSSASSTHQPELVISSSSSSSLFEDEATALQRDMLLMQQNLKERMQRYK
jgi:hypothetical protein